MERVTWAARLARLVVPVECPGCGRWDVTWCEGCEAPWWEEPVRCESGAPRLEALDPPLPVWAITELEGGVHGVIAAWKDAGRRDLDKPLAEAMRRAARTVAPSFGIAGEVAVVPCPARAAHTRRRGVDLPGLLARATASGLRDAGVAATVLPALAAPSGSRGRSGSGGSRGAGDRERWREGPARLRRAARGEGRATPVVLVDDVVTTGATLVRAARALEGTSLIVMGAFTLTSAPGVRGGARPALV